ncbi:MAG TPA: AI-2E family transporter [Conexibacter sp.]
MLIVVAALYVVYRLRKPISWLVIALFIAVALSGPVNLLSRKMPRGIAIALAYLGLILIPAGVVAVIVPPLVREGTNFANHVPEYVQDLQRFVNDNHQLRHLNQEYHIVQRLRDAAQGLPSHFDDAASTLSSVGSTIVSSLFAGVTIFILSVFMVAGGRRWVDRAIGFARPEHQARLGRAMDRIAAAVGNYVGGALLQAMIAGITTFIVLTILGVPFAAPLAVLTGLLDLVPLVGATIAAVLVGIVTAFHDFPVVTIIWVVWAIVYQQVENTLIQPQIQRRAVEVHAFVVLVAVLFGATLFGIIGALLAIPAAASIQIGMREWWEYRRAAQVEMPPGVDMPGPLDHQPDEPPERP